MTKLRTFCEESGVGMLIISHLKRSSGDKGHEDGLEVSLSHLRGSQSIAQLSDLVVSLERNISSGENAAKLRVLKNRFNGRTGPAGDLTYHPDTGRLLPAAIKFNPPQTTTSSYADL